MQTSAPKSPSWPFKRMMAELWLVGTALAFIGLDLMGINDPEARFLIILVAALLSIDVLAGAVCLLKGHIGIGILAVTAWLALPIAVAISSLVFNESWTAEFFGTLVGTAIVLVVAAPAVAIARGRPQFGSIWDRRHWSG
ncbi:MAG TPA: hypothetical protein VFL72_07220 [Acidimicrobiia bacterium]|nr:hypothetical protein [Acidimicrobiia bacterium]